MSTIPRRAAAALALTLLAGLTVLLLPRLIPGKPLAAPLSDCDLNAGPCVVRLDAQRSVELSITPRPIPVMQALTLSVVTRGFAAPAGARLDFTGVGMNMGPNQAELRRVAADRLAGEGTLPVCVSGSMQWQAELLIAGDDAAPARVTLRFLAPLAGR